MSRRRDIWELGLELTRLAAMEMTEAQREHWRTEDRDLMLSTIKVLSLYQQTEIAQLTRNSILDIAITLAPPFHWSTDSQATS